MQELYSEKDYQQISSQLKKRCLVLGIVLAALLAVFIVSLANRVEWLSIASLFLLCAAAIFIIDLFCLPLVRYRKLIRSALSGRTHTATLEFERLEEKTSMVDGVRCRELLFLGEPDKHGTREQRYYWDDELPLPDFHAGDQVTLKYTGANIIGWQS